MRKIDKIIIHCSATRSDQDIDAAEIRRWHKAPPRNWKDIGYHYVIKRDGEIEDGRPIGQVGAHCYGHNETSIGICVVGGVDDKNKPQDNFTDQQWRSLRNLIKICRADYKKATIHGHNEYANKACPSFDVQHELTEGRLR